ncbi:alpha/beta hydrolase [Methylobacterium haplocladii]|uniref:Alpha/beta hydrolase n=1 Tax=Methylobacterium haplocladii TaxID=1176176 RepID=A0A512INA7_9HYPH|nr:alpha/beta hydrolase [Methylobacterium haplocladii]GEO99196.1 alpha/beta hydrolase [Methylobacterium haplocladii]GJD83160.1 hypothetical protein HPGCJGGD_1023 [Methylobacterium haplocladii]GLS59100.1 alpha/beta hydrolase [Methylobacterium haplocladii]
MRIIGYGLLAILCLYGAAAGVLAFYQRRLIYPGAFEAIPHDDTVPAGAETVVVTTSDGERLHGLWTAPRPGCGVVLSFHGNASFPEPYAARFGGSPWREAGWGVLSIAYRGYPGSTGSPSEAGLIEDASSAYRFVSEKAPGAPVLLHGHSLGAAIAVALGAREPNLGLYLEAPFDSMSHVVRVHFPYVPSGLFLLDTYRSDLRVARGTAPVLIVHGDDDDVVPAELARELASAAGTRARIEVIPGDHVSILGSRDAEAEVLFRETMPAPCVAGR